MIAFIVPRREAGAAGGLPHLRFRLLGLAGCDRGGLQARVGGICVNPADRYYVLGFVALAQPMLFKLE
ncbi:hypothetical protein [Microcoleus vaginatus]|uniref:hypothetical protein n=1 Tax=Microcoleus vaginatus TaxID=119532 RepID=UPI001F60690F|nr:hypothetical protein D0A37_06340 [Microcoleus vaginatus HSN003]